jgi:hypothetical protein
MKQDVDESGQNPPQTMATMRKQVILPLFTGFENMTVFKPDSRQTASVNEMLDQPVAWGGALKSLRVPQGHLETA